MKQEAAVAVVPGVSTSLSACGTPSTADPKQLTLTTQRPYFTKGHEVSMWLWPSRS